MPVSPYIYQWEQRKDKLENSNVGYLQAVGKGEVSGVWD